MGALPPYPRLLFCLPHKKVGKKSHRCRKIAKNSIVSLKGMNSLSFAKLKQHSFFNAQQMNFFNAIFLRRKDVWVGEVCVIYFYAIFLRWEEVWV